MIYNVFVFILGLLTLNIAQARPELIVPAELELSQKATLHLGDMVVVKEATPELLALLDQIVVLKDARELLLSQQLKSSDILTVLRTQLQSDEAFKRINPGFKVPSQIKVSFSAAPISKAEVERKALNQLSAKCSDCEFKVNVQSTPFPYGKDWQIDYSATVAKGGFLLPMTDGENRPTKWISGNIRMMKLTPVATRMIQQGERLKTTDIQMQMTDVTFAKDSGVDPGQLEGQLAARLIAIGSPIWSSDLKREPAATRGQILKALLGDEDFEITTNVQAEENGFVGDVIKIKFLETKKVLSGVVIEKGVVKLQ